MKELNKSELEIFDQLPREMSAIRIIGSMLTKSIARAVNPGQRTLIALNQQHVRLISNDSIDQNRQPTEGEVKLTSILKAKFPKAKSIVVNDISGGCGSMYEVYVESSEFNKMRTVKQHQMVNKALHTEITQNMHGLRIFTSPVEEEAK